MNVIETNLDYMLLEKEQDPVEWIDLLWRKHPETYRHCIRVAFVAEKISAIMGLGSEEVDNLVRGCFLHDLGKAMIPEDIIQQRTPLTERQWEVVKLHPELGADLLRISSGFSEEVISVVLHHHERWDGSGYPYGLKGEEIPLAARICAVADAFDSMMSNRPYRNSLTMGEAKLELLRHRGSQFDSGVVSAFMKLSDQMLSMYSS